MRTYLRMPNSTSYSRRRVVITGVGAITPCGNSAVETWAALTAGRSGIGRITRFDATQCSAQIAGEVRNFDPARPLPAELAELLAGRGIKRLYEHQVAALDLAREGRDLVVVTGTASGKTLCYNLPILEAALAGLLSLKDEEK